MAFDTTSYILGSQRSGGGGDGESYTAESPITIENNVIGFDGYNVESTQLFSETLTTAWVDFGYQATMVYAGDPTTVSVMTIVFDGATYNCEQHGGSGMYLWGALSPTDFSIYPFTVLVIDGTWKLITETAGTHTISGSAGSVTTSAYFDNAVKKSLESVSDVFVVRFTYNGNDEEWNCDRTPAQIESAKDAGKSLVAYCGDILCNNIWYDSGITNAYYLVFDILKNELQYHSLHMDYEGTISETTVSYTLTRAN